MAGRKQDNNTQDTTDGAAAPSRKPRKKATAPPQTPPPSRLWRAIKLLITLTLLVFLGGAVGAAGLFHHFSQDLPPIFKADDYKPKQITRIYSSQGDLIEELVAPDGRRTLVDFDHISPFMRDAILAAEDADFYRHAGLDYIGMVRALYTALRYDKLHGASTITQQVVKNLILTPERTMKRKVQEILLARRLDEGLDKRDIHTIYLNQIYFGHGNYGVEEAARFFFGKPSEDLNLEEAALLAGVVQSPERLSPFKHPQRAVDRRRYVLEQMWQKGFVSEAQARAAMDAPLVLSRSAERDPHLDSAPFYTAHVQRLLADLYPGQEVAAMGLHVHTALSVPHQKRAEEALRKGLVNLDVRTGHYRPLRRLKNPSLIEKHRQDSRPRSRRGLKAQVAYEAVVTGVTATAVKVAVGDTTGTVALNPASRVNPEGKPLPRLFSPGDVLRVMSDKDLPPDATNVTFGFAPGAQGAIVAIDVQTRHVEALVGGFDFDASSFNRATQARRQTGSSFKPIVYGAALRERISTPATIWDDAPTPFVMDTGQSWSPKNADNSFKGPLTMRKALALSRNVVAVRILQKLTVPKATAFARDLGIESPIVDNLTMGLGSSELTVLETTSAFATLADKGRRAPPIFIVSILDAYGQPIYQARPEREQTIPHDVSWLLTDMMTSVLTEGTASRIGKQLKRPAAGKTGTTNKNRDVWFMGFTPHKVAGVWVGNDDNTSLGKGASGGGTAAPVWLDYMLFAHRKLPALDFEKPAIGIVDANIDPRNGLLASDDHKPRRKESFLAGTAPTDFAPEADENTVNDFLLGQGNDAADAADAEAED